MKNKREAINVLLSEEVNRGLMMAAIESGATKSEVVRYICKDYLTKNNLLPDVNEIRFQHL